MGSSNFESTVVVAVDPAVFFTLEVHTVGGCMRTGETLLFSSATFYV